MESPLGILPDDVSHTATAADYDVLRFLAQLAVNIVDQRDNDDINTPFVWNPIDPTMPFDPANFAPMELPNRVVYGVEKPRLVINEAYSEVTNDQATRGMNTPGANYEVRFWQLIPFRHGLARMKCTRAQA